MALTRFIHLKKGIFEGSNNQGVNALQTPYYRAYFKDFQLTSMTYLPKTLLASRNLGFLLSLFGVLVLATSCQTKEEKRPNILFCISDDQSYVHTSLQGTNEIKTPNLDRIAQSGIMFQNAYCNVASCSPSRASILTGKNIWELEEGGLLFGALQKKFVTFPQVLQQHGYATGYTGKGYGPSKLEEPYQTQPIAQGYNEIKMKAPEGISDIDYAENFKAFLAQKDSEQPFFFWYGGNEPHRGYKQGIGAENGKDISNIQVPGFLPDSEAVRSDIADYYYEIEWFDSHLGKMIKMLEATGELDNTIIITTADNGMPFPRAKATNYEYGTHMPLAIFWGNKIKSGLKIEDFISFTDFAPTLLEVAGIEIPEGMSGNSFKNVMLANKSGQVDAKRDRVFTAFERHTYCRPDGMPYPVRTIRKGDWLYLVNFEPDRYPAGDPDFLSPHQGYVGDIDAGPSRDYILANKEVDSLKQFYELAAGKRPGTELYNVKDDPYQLHNLAAQPEYANLCKELQTELFAYLKDTKDPRMEGLSPWDNYPYFFTGYDTKHLQPIGERDVE